VAFGLSVTTGVGPGRVAAGVASPFSGVAPDDSALPAADDPDELGPTPEAWIPGLVPEVADGLTLGVRADGLEDLLDALPDPLGVRLPPEVRVPTLGVEVAADVRGADRAAVGRELDVGAFGIRATAPLEAVVARRPFAI
jgi:hypothetical protein